MSKKIKTLCLAVCLIASLSFASALQAESNDTLDICASANFWLPGTIDIEGFEADKSGAILIKAFVDTMVVEKLSVGAYGNFAPSVEVESGSGSLYEFGGAIKYIAAVYGMPLKIGINIGYRVLTSEELDDDVEGLGLNAIAELQFKTTSSFKPFVEAGFLSQPTGGNELADVTWAPIFYVGGGIAF